MEWIAQIVFGTMHVKNDSGSRWIIPIPGFDGGLQLSDADGAYGHGTTPLNQVLLLSSSMR
jgi:hypothetical protein